MRRAAEAGNPTATYEMGFLYENGDGLPKDPVQSAQWYERGAQMGSAQAEAAVVTRGNSRDIKISLYDCQHHPAKNRAGDPYRLE